MTSIHAPRRAILGGALAGLMVAAALPVSAVNIPEGGAVTPDSVFLCQLRVTSACEGLPMAEREVTSPDSETTPVPEAMADWDTLITAPEEMDEEAEPTVITWSNGLLEDGYLLDFGIRARFPDEEGEVLEFPVVQRCGDVEQEFAPTIKLSTRYGQAEIAEIDAEVDQLSADVEVLRADVDQLQQQVGDVNVVNLRGRVGEAEKAINELDERVTALEEGEEAPEAEPAE